MRKYFIATLISVAALGSANVALAAGQFGGAPSGGNGSHAVTNSNGTKSVDRDLGKDRAADRAATKSKSSLNSNGIKSLDRDKGLARAADRRHRANRKTQPRK